MKKIALVCTMFVLALALAACGGNKVASIQEYFDSHPDNYADFMEGIKESAETYQGISTQVTVEGNDIHISLDVTEMYKSLGITDAEIAKVAFEEAGTESVESKAVELQNVIQELEKQTGVSGVRIVYDFSFDGEKVFEFVADKNGIVK